MQYWVPANYQLVKKALLKAGRNDLIGFDKKCLLRPERKNTANNKAVNNKEVNNKNTANNKRNMHKNNTKSNNSNNNRRRGR